MSSQVLIDLGKLKNIYSGLGQFSLNFGLQVSNIQHSIFEWNFLVPHDFSGYFGLRPNYKQISLIRRIFPVFYRNYDIWHAIHQDSAYMPRDSRTLYILTIHDLNFLEEKQGFKVMRRLRKLQEKVDRASYITFISNYTASLARENLNLGDKPQRIIYNGVDIDTEKKVNKPTYLPDGPFLFAIGMVLKKKNFHVLVNFMLKLPDYNLIIAGDKTSRYAGQLQKTIRQKNLSKRIMLPGIISEEDKIYLYRNCEAFLFPSLTEGFGLPVIEAMRFGKPVFCSRRSSLPEVGGNYAYYWDSFEPEEMKEIFVKHLQIFNDNMGELSKKNKTHSLKFKWNESIRQYLKVYDEVIQTQNKITTDELSVTPLQENLLDKSGNALERPIRVLHLSSEKSWRGGEQQIAYLIDELNTLGVQNYITCRKGSSFEKYCLEKEWDHYSLNFIPPFDIVTAYQINRICKKHQIDILHMHTSYGHTLGVLSSLFGCKARFILSRRVDNPIRNSWFTAWKYNHPRIEKILTVSDAIREILKNKLKDRSKILTVHSGINLSKFSHQSTVGYLRERYHLDHDTLLIGNTSALSDHKDYPTYLNVARYIINFGVNAKFFIIGTGEMKEVIQKIISDQQLEDHVIMTGFLNNLPAVLPELDIFLMTSKTEGLGTSILDAFACGVPVVATRAGGIPEMVIHEETGLLSSIGDFKVLGDNILRIINEPHLKEKLISNSKKMVRQNFSKEITARRTLEVYREILLM
jgi:glycosyltransferase involved in cell wall biosynthesis